MSQNYFLPHHPAYSRNVAKARAWREYHLAVADEKRGPDHPETMALWGRVSAFEHAADFEPEHLPDVALIAFYRANGEHSGILNRRERQYRDL